MTEPLNDRQQRFVFEIIRGSTATAAAIAAGYRPRSATSAGSRLLAEPGVRAAIDAGQAEIAREVSVSTKTLLAEAEAARALAERVENASAMIAAVQLKARLTGLIVDKPDPDQQREAAELARQVEQSTAAAMWAAAAESLGLARDAKPDQIVGAASQRHVWPPAVFRLARLAALQAASEGPAQPVPDEVVA
jgi:hypothetical protein